MRLCSGSESRPPTQAGKNTRDSPDLCWPVWPWPWPPDGAGLPPPPVVGDAVPPVVLPLPDGDEAWPPAEVWPWPWPWPPSACHPVPAQFYVLNLRVLEIFVINLLYTVFLLLDLTQCELEPNFRIETKY